MYEMTALNILIGSSMGYYFLCMLEIRNKYTDCSTIQQGLQRNTVHNICRHISFLHFKIISKKKQTKYHFLILIICTHY